MNFTYSKFLFYGVALLFFGCRDAEASNDDKPTHEYRSYRYTDSNCESLNKLLSRVSDGHLNDYDDLMTEMMCSTVQKDVGAYIGLSGATPGECIVSLNVQFRLLCVIDTEDHYKLLESNKMCVGIKKELENFRNNRLMPEQYEFLQSSCIGPSKTNCLKESIMADSFYIHKRCSDN